MPVVHDVISAGRIASIYSCHEARDGLACQRFTLACSDLQI